MWALVAVAIECVALAGVISVLATKRTHGAFVLGFNAMALVTGIYIWHFDLSTRAIVVLGMVVVYLVRMNWVLLPGLDKRHWRSWTTIRLQLASWPFQSS